MNKAFVFETINLPTKFGIANKIEMVYNLLYSTYYLNILLDFKIGWIKLVFHILSENNKSDDN